MATLLGGRPCCDPALFHAACVAHRLPTDWWGKANRFDLPVGREPGRGFVLLAAADLDALDPAADHDLVFSGTDPSHQYTVAGVTTLGATCLSPGGEGDPAAVFLVEVADRRYHLARIPADGAYNVDSADGSVYLDATTADGAGTPWDWQEVVDDLATACGLSTAQFALPFTPDATPENLTYWGGSAWDALCDVLDRVACAAKLDAETGEFSVVRLGEDDDAAAGVVDGLSGDRVWDAYPVDPARAWRPEKARVRFLRRPRPTDGSSPYYAVDVTLAAAAGVVAGTYVQLDDDLAALGASGSPSNAAACSTRAAERAADWLRKRGGFGRPARLVYRDFDPDVPGGALGSTYGKVRLDDTATPLADDGVMRTELVAAADRRLEDWRPLAVLPPWFPPDLPPTCERFSTGGQLNNDGAWHDFVWDGGGGTLLLPEAGTYLISYDGGCSGRLASITTSGTVPAGRNATLQVQVVEAVSLAVLSEKDPLYIYAASDGAGSWFFPFYTAVFSGQFLYTASAATTLTMRQKTTLSNATVDQANSTAGGRIGWLRVAAPPAGGCVG